MNRISVITYLLRVIASFFCFAVSFNAFSQSQISFSQLSVKQGLSQNSAISIAQDSIGYLWIATQNGLNKYDGRTFNIYPFDFLDITSPNYSNLGEVYVDRKGQVWIIPLDKILYKLNTTANIFEPIMGVSDVSTIYQDKNYNYWIGTYTQGLFFIDGLTEELSKVIEADQLNGVVYDINEQNAKEILITSDEQLIELNIDTKKPNFITPVSVLEKKIANNFSASLKDKSGKQWIGTFGGGLYYRDQNKNTLYRISQLNFNDPLPSDLNILDLFLDSKERLWVATYGRGLYMIDFNLKKITNYKADKQNPRALHYNDILCIYEDYSGTLWFGTDGAGLSFYDEFLEKFNSFTNLQTPENINIDVVRAIVVDNDDNVWIGTSGKGLTQYEPQTNSWRTFTSFNSMLPSDRIMSLFLDDENDLWIGTQGMGLTIYNDKESKFNEKIESLLPSITIWKIFKDSKGSIWLGTQNEGLIQFDKQKGVLKKYTFSNNIRTITEDNKGNLWIGTDANGLFKFNIEKEVFSSYTYKANENSIPGNSIKSLYYNDTMLWVGTNGNGLTAFDIENEIFYSFTEKDGLANDVIYGILPDKENNLWLSSNKGITKFSIDNDSLNSPTIINYNNYAGLATEFNTGAYFSDGKGRLYFGGLEGFYWFDPNSIKENSFLPKTTITSVEVFNEPFPIQTNSKFNYNQNTISFTFSSLQYSIPEKNLYQYKLENYDEDWIASGNINFARYSRLPPGDYIFKVKSSNYDGIWNETPATFDFTIKAPWFFNFYSKLAYVLFLLSFLYGIYWYLKGRWRMRLDLRLKEEEAQRFKKLNDYKSKLYTDIAHEFKTPLTLISGPIDSKLTEGNLSDYDYANFSIVKRNANRLTALVDQLLQLARLEKGKIKLRVFQGDLGLFLHSIAESFAYKASSKNIRYTVIIDKIAKAWYDEDVIEKIATNLLSNAFKYTPDNGICDFKVSLDGNNILLTVKNTTDNLPDLKNEDLFTRFYQKDEYAEGAGVGLSLVKELIKLYKGEIHVSSDEKNSITFAAKLPITKEAFTSHNIIDNKKVEVRHEQIVESIDISNNEQLQKAELPILLIVEDNTEVRAFIKLSLRHKFQILEAENGKVGVESAIEHVPDIILSDIRMPVYDGIELCNKLKADVRTSHIPIILLTANSGEENELQGLQSGADDFITKPFKLRLLEKRIDNLIQVRKALRDRYSQEFILKPTDISITSTDETFLNKLQSIIDTDFANPDFTAAEFSKKIGMSRMQLHRKLLAYTGLSTSAFIRSQRLKQAIEILKTSDATINEVAFMVGFNTPSYFIKCFKEAYKKTPSEYLQTIDK